MKLLNNSKLRQILLILLPYMWLVTLLLLPILVIVAISLSEYATTIPPFKLFIHKGSDNNWVVKPLWENFLILLDDSFYIKSYLNSIKLAFITTFCALFIGYPIALGVVNSSHNIKNLLLLVIILPFWTSLIIRVYAWSAILGDSGVINKLMMGMGLIDSSFHMLNSQFAIIIGMVYCYLPFMIMPLFVAIDKIEKELIEASLDLGCSPFVSFIKITLPLSVPGIVAGSILVFIPSIGEVIIPDLLGGNKILTLGSVIWNEFFYNRDWPVASAITVLLVCTFIIPLIIIQKIISKKEEDA